MSETWQPAIIAFHRHRRTPCTCLPLFPLTGPYEYTRESPGLPVAPALAQTLQAALAAHFPRITPFSLLLLHIAQFEHLPMSPTSPSAPDRLRFHAPASLLEQVLQMARRSLRTDDQILADEQGSGAAILFPEVDQEGIARIVGRVSASIHLLQAETVTPPLRSETEIVLGSCVCTRPAASPAVLLACPGRIWEAIRFRPVMSSSTRTPASASQHVRSAHAEKEPVSSIPFMQIPSRLPIRLQQLIPHTLALHLRCAPVGRNHNRLTVAMANPTDLCAISHLREATGLVIFPVACELSALETLLASGW
jgi:hypothetical protein